MRALTKLIAALPVLALPFAAVGIGSQPAATASPSTRAQQPAQQPGPAITINDFIYSPAQLNVKVGQPITITNNDGFNHTVTARDGTFNVDVPGNGRVTLTVGKAGSFPYHCIYHPGQHNPAKINAS